MTVLIYLGLSKLIFLKRLENILTFQSFNKNSVLADYYFDIGTLYTIERLNERIIIKDDHIYVVYNKNNVYYNPLTEAFYALVFYQRKKYDIFLKLLESLVKESLILKVKDKEVAFWFYRFPFYPRVIKRRWISGMAQGVVASVLARAFYMTKDNRYKDLCVKAIDGMLLSINSDGSLYIGDRWLWIEEYPYEKPLKHVLNGFMFSLLGLYDAYLITNDKKFLYIFQILVKSLESKMSYYDLVLWSKYDVENIADPKYHFIHIILLYILHKLSSRENLKYYLLKWMLGLKVFPLIALIIYLFKARKRKNLSEDC